MRRLIHHMTIMQYFHSQDDIKDAIFYIARRILLEMKHSEKPKEYFDLLSCLCKCPLDSRTGALFS